MIIFSGSSGSSAKRGSRPSRSKCSEIAHIKREDIRGVWTWKIQLIEFNNLIGHSGKENKEMMHNQCLPWCHSIARLHLAHFWTLVLLISQSRKASWRNDAVLTTSYLQGWRIDE
jgi:hypothetical protein